MNTVAALLQFVEKSNPLLREVISDIKNFHDPLLHKTIENMCYSILPEQLARAHGAHKSAAGMAANQWGIKKRIFIFTPEGSETGKKREIMLNPSYAPFLQEDETKPALIADYEGCFSIPLTAGLIHRYHAIKATYYNTDGEKIERFLQGWEARVFQHETDHLNGKLFDGRLDNYPGPECLERFTFKTSEEMHDFWMNIVKPSRANKYSK